MTPERMNLIRRISQEKEPGWVFEQYGEGLRSQHPYLHVFRERIIHPSKEAYSDAEHDMNLIELEGESALHRMREPYIEAILQTVEMGDHE